MRKSNFIKDFVFLFLLAFALTSMYDKIKIVFESSVSGWSIHWNIMWQSIGDLFTGYPIVMATIIIVIVFALYFIWRGRIAEDRSEGIVRKIDRIIELLENRSEESKPDGDDQAR